MLEFLYTFLLGGTFVSLIYYLANTINNPVLAAIIGFIPYNILCCYVMMSKEKLKSYLKYGFCVGFVTLSIILLGYLILLNCNIDKYILVTGMVISWLVLQFILYKFKNLIV